MTDADLLRESARLHRATVSLFETLPDKMRTKHLSTRADKIAEQLDELAYRMEG